MARLARSMAWDILSGIKSTRNRDFHRLNTDQVESLLAFADSHGYRKPKNANGSRARYFFAYVRRVADRAD